VQLTVLVALLGMLVLAWGAASFRAGSSPRQGGADFDQPGWECDQILSMGQSFEKFYRVDREEVGRAGGTGLGLYSTKRLVEMHGGRLWAESWPGVGSVFRCTLPTSDELAGTGR
jgi:hypothetical protein